MNTYIHCDTHLSAQWITHTNIYMTISEIATYEKVIIGNPANPDVAGQAGKRSLGYKHDDKTVPEPKTQETRAVMSKDKLEKMERIGFSNQSNSIFRGVQVSGRGGWYLGSREG